MAARRNRHTRRRNRGRFGFLYKLLSLLLIFTALLIGCLVFFRVDTIVVAGGGRYSEAEIIQAAGVVRGDNLYRLNKNRIVHQILSQLPYVDEVSISRRLPDTLVIQVTESSVMGVIRSGGEYWLLDARCKLLERGDNTLTEQWAEVLGLEPLSPTAGVKLAVELEQQNKLESLRGLLSAIQAQGMTGSLNGFIDLTSSSKIRFGYGADLTVVMPMNGDFAELTYKLRRCLEEMDAKGLVRTGTLDLSASDARGSLQPKRWLPGDDSPADPVVEATSAPEAGGE